LFLLFVTCVGEKTEERSLRPMTRARPARAEKGRRARSNPESRGRNGVSARSRGYAEANIVGYRYRDDHPAGQSAIGHAAGSLSANLMGHVPVPLPVAFAIITCAGAMSTKKNDGRRHSRADKHLLFILVSLRIAHDYESRNEEISSRPRCYFSLVQLLLRARVSL